MYADRERVIHSKKDGKMIILYPNKVLMIGYIQERGLINRTTKETKRYLYSLIL